MKVWPKSAGSYEIANRLVLPCWCSAVVALAILQGLALSQNTSADPIANPWCSSVEVSKNPGGCSDLARIPLRAGDGIKLPAASRLKIAKTWTRLVRGFIEANDRLTPDENSAADAILMQIQGALLALGFMPAEPGKAAARAEYVSRLVPNTSALARYLERKRRENPKDNELAKLYTDAKALSEEVRLVAPTIPAKP